VVAKNNGFEILIFKEHGTANLDRDETVDAGYPVAIKGAALYLTTDE